MNNVVKNQNSKKFLNIEHINSLIHNLIKNQKDFNSVNNNNNRATTPFNNIYEKFILSKNIDNILCKISSFKFYNKKWDRILEYINKLILSGKSIIFKNKETQQKDLSFELIYLSIYLLKNKINKNQKYSVQKFFEVLIIIIYSNNLSLEYFIFIIFLFLKSGIEIITKENIIIDNNLAFKRSPLSFINCLFKALNRIPRKLINETIHLQLIEQLINLLDQNIFTIPYYLHSNKLNVWLKLLGNKPLYKDNEFFSYNKIIYFLVKIYKYNFKNIFLFKNIYEKASVSFDYYINSIDFLCSLFKEEEKQWKNNDFKIKSGFYIFSNNPLILNNVQFKTNVYSLIFSFKLTKIENIESDTVLLNVTNNENKIILKFVISPGQNILKIIGAKNAEWTTNLIINKNKEYLICLTQEKKSLKKRIHLYINNKTNEKSNNTEYENMISNLIEYPEFDQPLTFELGKSNFEGVFGDFFILNKKIKEREIVHLYNLKEDYSDIIPSINYKWDYTFKKKKYLKDGNESPDILYFKILKYHCVLKILSYQVNELLPNQNTLFIKPYGELRYSKNINDNRMNIQTYNKHWSIYDFLHLHGFDYIIFQLHKIKSLSEDNECLNFYLYKTLSFILEYIQIADDYIFSMTSNKIKIELKFVVFYLNLIIILNSKKRSYDLNENIRKILLEFIEVFRNKKAMILQKMNFCILFDTKLFKTNQFINYNKLFDEMLWHLDNNDKDNSLFLFYKILLFDNFFEISSKEVKHKKYMKIISKFISDNKRAKTKSLINENFIKYFINVKSPKKIYHYLKIIYYELNSIKSLYKENIDFINYIIKNYNNLDDYNCKYRCNIQILSFLLYDIIINNSNEKSEAFSYTPYGFMKYPNYIFIRCIFIQCFKLTNGQKLKFIKSSLYYDNEIDVLKNILETDNINIFSLIEFDNFIPKLDAIIKYYCYLYNEYLTIRNINILKLLKRSIKLVLDLLDKIIYKNEFDTNTITPEPNEVEKKLTNHFIQKLFTCQCIKLLFILYFNIFNEQELKDLKNLEKYIQFSINSVYNPFYFYLLLPFVNLSNNFHLNNAYKYTIFNMIITKIILANNTFKINMINNDANTNKDLSNDKLVLNSIIILIRIYNIIHNNENILLLKKIEKSVYIYLKYILENNFLYSKFIFNINLKEENVIINEEKNKKDKKNNKKKDNIEKEKKSYKFLAEITLDIIFFLLSKKEENDLITLLINNLNLKNENTIFYEIDEYFLTDANPNKNTNIFTYNMINLLNSKKINTNYIHGINSNSIIFSIYFFYYFISKRKTMKKNIKKELENLFQKIIQLLFKDIISIFNKNIKKIKKIKTKIASNEIAFKIYYIFFEHFLSKYKDKNFKLKESNEIIYYFQKFLKDSKEINKIEKNKDNNLDKTEPLINIHSTRKTSYIPDDNLLLNLNGRETVNTYIVTQKNDLSTKRCRSLSNEEGPKDKYNNILNTKNEDSIHSSDNNSRIKTPKKVNRYLDSDNSTVTTNLNIIDFSSEINSENSYENYNLGFNSNYICNNNINFTEEKFNRRVKNDFYLNNKNFTSSICLNTIILQNNNMNNEEEPSDFTLEEGRKKIKRYKLSENNLRIEDIEMDTIQKNIEEENIEETDDIEDNHQFILDKLKEFDIPYLFFIDFAQKDEPKWAKALFNPKREMMRIFGFIFRKFIYNNQNFKKMKTCFKIKFKNKYLEHSMDEEENYYLNYPTKLKNFTCNDYYRPFLKPMLNYFETEYFYNSHPYLKQSVIENDICLEDQFAKVEYENILLILNQKKSDFRVKCENISNKGSIYGALHLHNTLMIFEDRSNKDHRLTTKKEESQLFYLFSSEINDRLEGKNKFIIIYYLDIKEIILRKFCFTDIGYEIFLKDNRSYYFNFFNIENRKKFYNSINIKINNLNSKLRKDLKITDYYINKADLIFINEPRQYFDRKDIKSSYAKNEITNFQYLLLVNKFSNRSYNDNCQYLIFPLLYMDIEKKIERDLSKAICLNKDLTEEDYLRFKSNYESMGYHFNSHYSTMAYANYYLMRVFPFTNCQIKFQSGHFDSPSRMFSSLENLLVVFQISDENRELCPECFYGYEIFLNLNYNDFGYINLDKKQVNNFNTNQNCGIVDFVINLREMLEKKELSPWINNIFGYKQLDGNYESFNSYPTYSYEQYNNLEKEKEEILELKSRNTIIEIIDKKIKAIKNKLSLLSLGLTPVQLFKGPHPTKETYSRNTINKNTINHENKNILQIKNLLKKKSIKYTINKYLQEFITKGNLSNLLYSFNNFNYNENIKIIFMFKNQMKIFNYLSENDKDIPHINIHLEEEISILNIKPYRNILIEMYENIFLLCRLMNRTLLLFSEKQKIYIEWPSTVTAIEGYSHSISSLNKNVNKEIHINEIIIGDEEGYLSIVEIVTEYIDKKKEFKIEFLKNVKRNKAHYSYINGIMYNKRLNIIISSCGEGIITINNGYSFDILNIINIGKNLNIIEFKLSKYDLLYIYTSRKKNNKITYELNCFTLNGIRVSNLYNENEYISFYINNNNLYTVNKDGYINEYNSSNFREITCTINKNELLNLKDAGKALHCICCSKLSSIFIIFNKEFKNIEINN